MPYRINPKNKKQVQVQRGRRWASLKTHPSARAAAKHLAALNINVAAKEKGKRKRG